MRAFVITAPGEYSVQDVHPPAAAAGQVVIDVERVGVCGTDVELLSGEMPYLHDGSAKYPLRPGHEWCGRVRAVGPDIDDRWLGVRVTGDTMLGCREYHRCRSGRQHLCERRFEVGIRGGFPGALAEQLAVPVTALHRLPESLDPTLGALVEPGGNALRAVRAAGLRAGEKLLIVGAGTIGLIAALVAAAEQIEVHLLDPSDRARGAARQHGLERLWATGADPDLRAIAFDAVIDASGSPEAPALALQLVEPGRRAVLIGLAGTPSILDSRALVLAEITAVGILSASPGLAETIRLYASGSVDPRMLVAATVGLADVGAVLGGRRPDDAGDGPKIHIDPTR